MKEMLWNATKLGLLFFAVGAVLAAALPYVAVATGLAETTALATSTLHIASPVWLGIIFGGFGVLDAALRPAFDYMFGKNPPQDGTANISRAAETHIHIHKDAPAMEFDNCASCDHAKQVKEQRQQLQTGEITLR